MNIWDEIKARCWEQAKRTLLKILPGGILVFVMLVVFVKVFSVAALGATIKNTPLFINIGVIVMTPATIILMVAVVGGAIENQVGMRKAAKDKAKPPVVTEAKMESLAAASPEPARSFQGTLTLWQWIRGGRKLFQEDVIIPKNKPEAK